MSWTEKIDMQNTILKHKKRHNWNIKNWQKWVSSLPPIYGVLLLSIIFFSVTLWHHLLYKWLDFTFFEEKYVWGVIRRITTIFGWLVTKYWIKNGIWWTNDSPKSKYLHKCAALASPCVSLSYFIPFSFNFRKDSTLDGNILRKNMGHIRHYE